MIAFALFVSVVLTVYLLFIAWVCVKKLRGVRPWRLALCLLFPASQLCLVQLALWCAATHGASVPAVAVVAMLGVAAGPVDSLLFDALRVACRYAEAAEQVRELRDQVKTQELLRGRWAREREEAIRVRERIAEQLDVVEAGLCRAKAAEVDEGLDGVIGALGGKSSRWCAHPAIDALVDLKADAARGQGVRFTTRLNVPLDLAFPSVEVCAIFSNLIDNALTACGAVQPEARFVDVAARLWGRYFVVDVENSCAVDACGEGGETVAHKTAGEGDAFDVSATSVDIAPAQPAVPDLSSVHGWGQGIVEVVATRHDGQLVTSSENGVYRARVIVRLDGGDA